MRAALLLFPLLAVSCGTGETNTPATPARLKLVEQADGVLRSTLEEPAAAVLLRSGSGDPESDTLPWDAWRIATDAKDAFHEEPGFLELAADGSRLTLSGRRGFVYRVVSVEPSTCYRFAVRARAEDLAFAPLPPDAEE